MQPKDALDIVAYAAAISAALVIVKSNYKRQTIEDLKNLAATHESLIAALKLQNEQQAIEIVELRETIDGYSELVREGYLAGGNRQGGRNSSAYSKNSKNRGP